MNKYEGMSLEQLDAAISELQAQKDAVREELKAANAARDSKIAQEAARAKLASLSDVERAALAQVIQAEGITSTESFGNL
jgi:hypothetical protein